ncbi:MAG: N-acetylmuramoyl-L-alanine amidase [Verrucomicrobiaceae bacterium]|nr:N-acetylmuramoyl-L-alanine amidase [Verrucomicrobiaceae bacterium]
MKHLRFIIPSALFAVALLILASCNTHPAAPRTKAGFWERELGAVANAPLNPADAQKALNLKVNLIPEGKYGRRLFREMKPRYITIHSTQNPTGDAYAHAKALNRGALRGGVCGYLCWHFTVQEDTVIQHIPTSERGEHADFDGPGNRYSIGIEMCEHKGNDQLATLERTAKLAASLMYHHQIPVENIRAHYHWPRKGYSTPNKDCPHFLLENGQPGETWRWFVGRINRHYTRLVQFDEAVRQQKQQEEEARRRKQMVQWIWTRMGDLIGLG